MNEKQFSVIKWYLVGFVTLTIWTMLIWQYLHTGVPSHYFLQRADMPEISNWWGGFLLPFLTWLAMVRVQKRLLKKPSEHTRLLCKQALFSFATALCYGAMLSLSFVTGYTEISAILFPAILFIAIFFRVYREEFILGFILSMSITFGAVLPTIFGAVIALASAIVYFFVQFIYLKIKIYTATKPRDEGN
ncbi:hypothetical protein [Cognaticolwellia beringensis]|uniref:Uncharacterized protein n=1 Tax=Cognaticolwellia beringensis TaxID=1967665 RepID=A0A222G828_9GAMM|nr:hypothetical protein [Cognaticolwellia beringensis]ASP48055.1 hypothetical protein B5D82_09945 [Cognaticolwellia beringensis]